MVSQQDKRQKKFEEMSGFQEIEVDVEEGFAEKVEQCIIDVLEFILGLTKIFFLPLTARFAIIYLIASLMFYGEDAVYSVTRIIFLIVLLVYESRG